MLPFAFFREAFTNDADLDTARRVYTALSPDPYHSSRRESISPVSKFWTCRAAG